VFDFLNPWSLGVLFQVLMVVHFIRNRPETYWFFVILFLGPIGAVVYFFVEVMPGLHWKMPAIERWERKRRRQWLERLVVDAPSQEALGELATLCARDGEHERAVKLFGEALNRDPGDVDSLYGRGLSLMSLGSYESAAADFTQLAERDPSFKFQSGNLALAEAYEGLGQDDRALAVYRSILGRTTVSAAYYGLARLLAKRGDTTEARSMLEEILAKQTGLPRYLRRQERPWVWKARAMLKTMPASAGP